MDAFLVQVSQRLGRAMAIEDAEYMNPNELLLEIQAAEHGDDEFLLLYNFINSYNAVELFTDGKGNPDRYEAAKKAHKKNAAALKARIDALEAANAHHDGD